MGTFGKVLVILNVLAGIGFLLLAGLDYGLRQSWAYRVQTQQFILRGLPVDDQEPGPDGRPLLEVLGKQMQETLFAGAGNPVRTQVEAVTKRHDQIASAVRSAGNEAEARERLKEALVPLARSEGGREELRQQIDNPKASVDDLLGPEGPLETNFREAAKGPAGGGQQRDYDQWRAAIAHVLFNTGEEYRWTLAVVGGNAYAREADSQADALAHMVEPLNKILSRDRADFVLSHRALIGQILALRDRLRTVTDTLAKQREVLERNQSLVRVRTAERDALLQQIKDAQQATQEALAQQTKLEQDLWNAQRTIATTEANNLQLERRIRERENVR